MEHKPSAQVSPEQPCSWSVCRFTIGGTSMKSSRWVTILLSLFALLLGACGGGAAAPPESTAPTATGANAQATAAPAQANAATSAPTQGAEATAAPASASGDK